MGLLLNLRSVDRTSQAYHATALRDLTITAVGFDRPGIVAAVTRVFLDLGCNLADCAMSRLRDQFAMILLVEAPDEVSVERLEKAIRKPAYRLGLTTSVREAVHEQELPPGSSYVISLYGADRPGIVHRVARVLAERGTNITDLKSHLVEGTYRLVLDVAIPTGQDVADLEAELKAIAEELDVYLTFRSAEVSEL